MIWLNIACHAKLAFFRNISQILCGKFANYLPASYLCAINRIIVYCTFYDTPLLHQLHHHRLSFATIAAVVRVLKKSL